MAAPGLAARRQLPGRSLAELYNPIAMAPRLLSAHANLDELGDRAFGAARTCTTELERQELLFARYQDAMTTPLAGRPR